MQIDQLFRIFERLGTPTADVWPSLSTLPDWCDKFPKFRGQVRCLPHAHSAPARVVARAHAPCSRRASEWPPRARCTNAHTPPPARSAAQTWSAVTPRLCDHGRDLLARMLTYDPAKRISAADALAHPYFTATGVVYPLPMLAGQPQPVARSAAGSAHDATHR